MNKFGNRAIVILAWLYFGTLIASGVVLMYNMVTWGPDIQPALVIFFGTGALPIAAAVIGTAIITLLKFIEWSVQQWN